MDIANLDEIRIVKIANLDEIRIVKDGYIINDFSIIADDEADTLYQIKKSLGIEYLSDAGYNKKVVFVEGVTDYNYLNAMSYACKKDNFVFLPIGGLGKFEDSNKNKDEIISTETQEQKKQQLIKLAKYTKDNIALLLVDGDRAGKAMAKLEDNKLKVIEINENIGDEFKNIEDFFSDNLRSEFEMDSKSNTPSSDFKNRVKFGDIDIDKQTKDRFNKLFEYLESC